MTGLAVVFALVALGSALLAAGLPDRPAALVLMASAALALGYYAPLSLLWLLVLLGAIKAVPGLGGGRGRDLAVAAVSLAAVAALLLLREWPAVVWVGGAYFTLRNLHVLLDWWMGQQPMPGWFALLRYNLFPPVLIAGPIHRLPHFQRQWQRRRVTVDDLACGAERMLMGAASVVILGGWIVAEAMRPLQHLPAPGFGPQWALSALDWVHLYAVFAGLSSIAIGAARIAGLRIEENFVQPWRARNLIEFWTRWHITLSLWCRDYVYRPAATAARSPVLGVLAAMVALGLWHQTSVYYLLWGLWQTLGIVAAHLLLRRLPSPGPLRRLAAPALVLGWLSLARPVIALWLPMAAP